MDSSESVERLLMDRLATASLGADAVELVLAALAGDEELADRLTGSPTGARHSPAATSEGPPSVAEPARAYLAAVRVAGFRGIGRPAMLELAPGPGLTVITGRNGSGKSSFAEAVEYALTGDNQRWSGRAAVWRNGWRNLHDGDTASILVELAIDGQPGPAKVARVWKSGDDLAGAAGYSQLAGRPKQPIDALGWGRALEIYRPFLSYAELGRLVEGRPTEMHDAVEAILGLDQLVAAETRLVGARKQLDGKVKLARTELPALRTRLNDHPDPRAAQAAVALEGSARWDLDTAEQVAAGAQATADGDLTGLRELSRLALPARDAVDAALARLTEAAAERAELSGSPAAEARNLAGLLSAALAHHDAHPGQVCPVCAGRVLDDTWATGARAEIDRLSAAAAAADQAQVEYDGALWEVRALATPVPAALSGGPVAGIDPAAAVAAWQAWTSVIGGLAEGFEVAERAHQRAYDAVAAVQHAAAEELRRRDDAWRPLATELAAWVATARTSAAAAASLSAVKAAISWLRSAGQEIRNARLAPFADLSAKVWAELRQESNVELGPIRLEGAATMRRVALDVTVDGRDGAALGVMSQGELHALGLALFLPRATAEASPFRFVVIDDPVQSMDPAKVDGLARVLATAAATRQVIVFTHDDRLPEALRRLQLPATVWAVTRRENSAVDLRRVTDPVAMYLDDARALAGTDQLPAAARGVVVTGLCRGAIEAACHDAVRRHRLVKGVPHADVERALTEAGTLCETASLAIFDDAGRSGEVLPKIKAKYGPSYANAFAAANDGVHGTYSNALPELVRDIERLTTKLRP